MRRRTWKALLICAVMGWIGPVAAEDPTGAVPAETLIYLGWSGSDSLEEVLPATSLGRLLADPAVGRLKVQLAAAVESRLGPPGGSGPRAHLDRLLGTGERLFRHPGAFAIIDLSISQKGPDPQVILCSRVGEEADALTRDLLGLLVLAGFQPDGNQKIGDHDLMKLSSPIMPLSLLVGRIDDFLVLSPSEAAVAWVDRSLDLASRPLSDHPHFRRVRPKLARGSKFPVYCIHVDAPRLRERVGALSKQLGQPLPAPVVSFLEASGLNQVGPITYLLSIVGEGFQGVGRVPLPPPTTEQSVFYPEDLEFVPRGTINFSIWSDDWAARFRQMRGLLGLLGEVTGEDLVGGLESVENTLGFRIDDDLLGSLGPGGLVFEDPEFRGLLFPGYTFVFQPSDFDRLGEHLAKLVTLAQGALQPIPDLENVRLEVRSYEHRGHRIGFLHTAGIPVPITLGWARIGPKLIVSLHPTGVEHVIDRRKEAESGSGSSILGSADFRRVRGRLPDFLSSLDYYDARQGVELNYPTLVHLTQMMFGFLAHAEVDLDLDASMLISPRTARSLAFGDVVATYRSKQGLEFSHHGPLPVPAPRVGGSSLGWLATGSVLAGIMIPTVKGARDRADRAIRINSLKQISRMSLHYATEHKNWCPPDLETLREFFPEVDDDVFSPPGGDWVYVGGHRISATDAVLLHDSAPDENGNMIVFFVDGSYEELPEAEARRRIAETRQRLGK